MILNLRFRHIGPILAVLLSDRAFSELVYPEEDAPFLRLYSYLLVAMAVVLAVCYYRALTPVLRWWLLALVAALAALSLESYAGWDSWMEYPHVFFKLLAVLLVPGLAAYYRRHGLPPLGLLMALVGLGIAANLMFFHPDALSLSAFMNTERGFVVTSAMLVLLPTLYYFNQYLSQGGIMRLMAFFVGAGLIIFLQHRSVWLAMGLALALNLALLALGRVSGARLSLKRLLPMFLLPFVMLISGGLVVLGDEQVRRKFEHNIQDILHPDKQGTGSWRLLQYEAYVPYLQEYPVAGMRLKGFELPVQFYSPDTHEQVWGNGTGHHFHSFYVDRLFYFGLCGVLLTLLVPVGLLGRRLLQSTPFSPQAAALVSFSVSTLLYGVSYDWPVYFFGILGLSLAAAWPRVTPASPATLFKQLPAATPSAVPVRYAFHSSRPGRAAADDARPAHRI